MIKLKLKPSYELGVTEIQYYDLFVSQDLSFISGRTNSQNSVFDGEKIKIVNNNNKFATVLKAIAENVTIKGKVFYDKELPVKRIKRILNVPQDMYYETVEMENTYIEYNGDICFYCDAIGGYVVDHILYTVPKTDKSVTINTFAYIEGSYAVVDGEEYYVDFSNPEKPFKEFPYKITDVVLFGRKKWRKETKFKFIKEENTHFDIDDALYGGYENYVTYKDEKYILSYLYEQDENDERKCIGYGVELDGNIYTDIGLYYVDEYVFKAHKDIDLSDSALELTSSDYLIIDSNKCSFADGGNYIFLISHSEDLGVKEGNYILATSTAPINKKYFVNKDEEGNQYVFFNNTKYDVVEYLYDYVTISERNYRLIYDNDEKTEAHAFVNGETMYFTTEKDDDDLPYLVVPTNKIYFLNAEENDIDYGIYKDGYDVIHSEGVKIGDEYYQVFADENEEGEIIQKYITVYEDAKYELYVSDIEGSSTYSCIPNVQYEEIRDEFEIDAEKRAICETISNNLDSFTFKIRNDIFGELEGEPENFLYESMTSKEPVNFIGHLNLSLYKINSYINAKLPFISKVGNNVLKEDIVNSALADKIKSNSYKSIVDMEKDIYYPVYYDGFDYNSINEVRFNLHFRTRQLDTWKVIEDYVEVSRVENVQDFSNWFICDYSFYNTRLKDGVKLQNVSDLVGYMNFNDSEVKNMANKISKSFLRLSFYSTNNPNTQVLLGTSTVFLDEALLAKKIFANSVSAGRTYIKTQEYQDFEQNSDTSNCVSNFCTVDGEIKDGDTYTFDEDFRLSSRLTIKDKHNSDTSSEGYYFYMFREFANGLRPTRIYMKIDFNHAGIGKSIPMTIPRDANDIPLYLHVESDLKKLKEGFKFKDIYNQLYIPIDVIYDEKNNRYVYYQPESIRENSELDVSNDIMEFNLFEIKFKDESINITNNES